MYSHPIQFFQKYNLNPRPQQVQIINAVKENWSKYKYFALSCPTGVGKTYIATSIADALNKSYILTSTLQLQNQYESSWEEIVNLKGRGNYRCNVNSAFSVDAAPCTAHTELIKVCKENRTCSYYNQKNKAIAARSMITNPVYMLYSTHCGFAKEDEKQDFVQRDVLIMDEAHNIENHLVQFAESDVDPDRYYKDFDIAEMKAMQFNGDLIHDYQMVQKIQQLLMDKASAIAVQIEGEFPNKHLFGADPRAWAKGINAKVAERVKKLNAKAYAVDKAIQPLKIFFSTHSTPDELVKRWIVSKYDDKNVLKLAPLYGDFLFHHYLGRLANKFIFLSATLPPKEEFCKELGIPQDECLYIETDSPFNPDLSPVIVWPSINLSKKHIQNNLEKLGPIIDEILKMHVGERGIIHAVTYDLSREIFNRVSPEQKNRLLCRDMDVLRGAHGHNGYVKRYSNEELLSLHESEGSENGSVLVSPSMMEGVDLKDDLSMFQIILKLPWPNLGDVRVRHKCDLDGDWYTNKMWLNVLQASGRSTRHENDSSVTYILDSNFKYFYGQWKHKLPAWFKRRLVF